MENQNHVDFAPRFETTRPMEENADDRQRVAVQESHGGVLTKWDNATKLVRHNIDPTRTEGRSLISRCREVADLKIRNAAGRVWPVVQYYAHVVELVSEDTGEVREAVRLVMVTRSGKLISTVSRPFIEGFAAICNFLPNGEWKTPVLIKVTETKGRSGHTYCTCCEMVDTPETRKMLGEPIEDEAADDAKPRAKGK